MERRTTLSKDENRQVWIENEMKKPDKYFFYSPFTVGHTIEKYGRKYKDVTINWYIMKRDEDLYRRNYLLSEWIKFRANEGDKKSIKSTIKGLNEYFTAEEYIAFQKYLYEEHNWFCFARIWALNNINYKTFSVLEIPFDRNRCLTSLRPPIKNINCDIIQCCPR